MKKIKMFKLVSVITFISCQAIADNNMLSYQPGRLETNLTVNYYKTNANFSSGGSKTDLPSSNYLQTIDTLAEVRYVLPSDLGLSAGLNIANAESSDVFATRKNSALSKLNVGADYLFVRSILYNLSAQVSYSQALEKFKSNTDSVIISDGANELTAVLSSTFYLDSAMPFFKGGFKYRTEGLSNLFVYTAGIEYRFDETAFGGLIDGFMSITDDDYSNQSMVREAVTNRVNAYSKKYYSVNPNQIDSELYFKFSVNKNINVRTFAGYTLAGSNTSQGMHAGATLTWIFGHKSSEESRPKKVQQPSIRPSIPVKSDSGSGFKEDTNDGVNQDYFKPVAPKDEPIEAPVDPLPVKKKKVIPPANSDSGYQIKLKKIKKKKTP